MKPESDEKGEGTECNPIHAKDFILETFQMTTKKKIRITNAITCCSILLPPPSSHHKKNFINYYKSHLDIFHSGKDYIFPASNSLSITPESQSSIRININNSNHDY